MRIDTDWINEGRLLLSDIMDMVPEGEDCRMIKDLEGWVAVLAKPKPGKATIHKWASPWYFVPRNLDPASYWREMTRAWGDMESNLVRGGDSVITKGEELVLWYLKSQVCKLIEGLSLPRNHDRICISFYSGVKTGWQQNPIRSKDDISPFRRV